MRSLQIVDMCWSRACPCVIRTKGERTCTCDVLRDGNSARGHGYPRVSYPMGKDTDKKSRPRVRIRATLLTRG
jgi:hypothetical protein